MLSQDNVQQKSAQPAESEMQWALPIAGMPFSAEMVTERSDGRDGTEPQVTLIYRDAKGRVLHE